MKVYIISGGPSTGKTSVVRELGNQGFIILQEAAREVAETEERFIGKSINEINQQEFHDSILEVQIRQIKKLEEGGGPVFSDRGVVDTFAYYNLYKLSIPKKIFSFLSEFRYNGIFILEPLDFYKKDNLRQETEKEQKKIHETIIKTYQDFNYEPIRVPFMSVRKRVKFILENI